jgi:hypothetical protein
VVKYAPLLLPPLTFPGEQLVHDGKQGLAPGPFEPHTPQAPSEAKGDECSDDKSGVSCCHASPVRAHAKKAWNLNGEKSGSPQLTVARAGYHHWFYGYQPAAPSLGTSLARARIPQRSSRRLIHTNALGL